MGGNRYGYGRSQADYLDKEYVPDHVSTGGDTTEETVIKALIDGAITEAEALTATPTWGTIIAGFFFAEDGTIDPISYPTLSELITRYATICVRYKELVDAIGSGFGTHTCNGYSPDIPDLDILGGTLAGVHAEAVGAIDYFADLVGSTYYPYISKITNTQWNAMIDTWAALSAHPSGSPFDVVTPATSINWAYDPASSYPDFLEWMEDLAAGSGSGAIYVSDV